LSPLLHLTLFVFLPTSRTRAPPLSLHDALPISLAMSLPVDSVCINPLRVPDLALAADLLSRILEIDGDTLLGKMASAVDNHRGLDRKSTRLNSSHRTISYAVFCLKKKKRQVSNY